MDILVLGGSYFLGRCFVKLASKDHHVTVINRGNAPLAMENVTELVCDRRDMKALKELELQKKYDVLVDFCGYRKNDIKLVLRSIKADINQYIFVSTVDVYKRGTGEKIDESFPYETRDFGGEAGEYILGKVALEEELRSECEKKGIAYTSVRPAFIYGEGNYAPRENIYFKWIKNAGQIITPADSDGFFQLVYVEDVARILLDACGNKAYYDEAFNICDDECITYKKWRDILKAVTGAGLEDIKLSVEDINKKRIPLPFPLTKTESNYYSGDKIKKLGATYTDINEGLRKVWQAYIVPQQ